MGFTRLLPLCMSCSVVACTLASCPTESAPIDPPRIIPLGLQSKGHSLDATSSSQSGHAPPPRRPGARFHQSAVPAAGWSRPAIPLGPKSISHTRLLQSLRLSLDTAPPPPGTPKPQQGPPQCQHSHMLIYRMMCPLQTPPGKFRSRHACPGQSLPFPPPSAQSGGT
jgi:hypothetical protein